MNEISQEALKAASSAVATTYKAPLEARPPASGTAQVQAAFDSLRANRWKMARTTAKERSERIRRLRDALLARRDELCKAVWDDYRKNAAEVELTEIFPVVSEANHAIRHLAKWMKPQRVGTPLALLGTHSVVRCEPRGVVLILAPWNYPFQLLVSPLIAAISAGNVVAVRASSKVPHTARFLAKFIGDLFPPEEVAVFEGDHTVSDALLELPFDHIFFTGSPRIGKKVMAAAAKHLASVTLELGGKSPVIVDQSADMAKSAERILWGKFVNAGQTCVAPDYALIHESRVEEFVGQAKRVLGTRYGETEEARRASDSFCRLVSDDHHRGVTKVLDAAVHAGAKVAVGGVSKPDERYLSPTLLTGVTEDNPIMQEEIFGPILPIIAYRDLADATRLIQSKPKPLALYVFAQDRKVIDTVLEQTTAGGSCVNATMIHLGNGNLPFGGVGNSGIGNYHGHYGFRACSHERAVLTQGILDSLKMFYPPYTPKVKNLLRTAIRFLA
jgi:aldehyde dehydrogenase (NAD+)